MITPTNKRFWKVLKLLIMIWKV